MSLLFVLTTQFLTYTLITLMMMTIDTDYNVYRSCATEPDATFNFRLDTLLHEIEMHEHREEVIELLREQVADDNE